MEASHAAVGVGTTASTAWLTTLLTGYHGLDSDHAAAAAGLITLIVGALAGLLQNKWPQLFGQVPPPPPPPPVIPH